MAGIEGNVRPPDLIGNFEIQRRKEGSYIVFGGGEKACKITGVTDKLNERQIENIRFAVREILLNPKLETVLKNPHEFTIEIQDKKVVITSNKTKDIAPIILHFPAQEKESKEVDETGSKNVALLQSLQGKGAMAVSQPGKKGWKDTAKTIFTLGGAIKYWKSAWKSAKAEVLKGKEIKDLTQSEKAKLETARNKIRVASRVHYFFAGICSIIISIVAIPLRLIEAGILANEVRKKQGVGLATAHWFKLAGKSVNTEPIAEATSTLFFSTVGTRNIGMPKPSRSTAEKIGDSTTRKYMWLMSHMRAKEVREFDLKSWWNKEPESPSVSRSKDTASKSR